MMTIGFDEAWATADKLEGWLTREQASALWDAATRVPSGGLIVEIGSHRGRSTVMLALAAPEARIVAIDPFDNPRWGGGLESRSVFEDNLARAGAKNVELRANLSTELRPAWAQDIDMLYIDGAHDLPTVEDDLEWAKHVRPGCGIFVHDAFSSGGVTRAIFNRLFRRRDLRYLGRTGSLASFSAAPATPASVARATVGGGSWFVRNVAVKVCIRRGWRGPAAVLGQPDMSMPY
jgi:predicted O-methyltransferase YrrM